MASSRAATLKSYFTGPSTKLRPVLTSLNGDNSWLLSLPIPPAERATHGKLYYHIVSDPWLAGPWITINSWLMYIGPVTPPHVRDGTGVEAIAQEIENAAVAAGPASGTSSDRPESALIDAIFVNFFLQDHMNEPTLRTFEPSIPVFASLEAAPTISSWKHFDKVITTNDLDPDANGSWNGLHPGHPLPQWLNVFRLVGHHELQFCTVIVWSPDEHTNEVLLYSPHGIRANQPSLQAFLNGKARPSYSILAMLHALKVNWAKGQQQTLGVAGGLALERAAKPKYWVKSHDAPTTYWGLFMVMAWVRDVAKTLGEGLEEESKTGGVSDGGKERPNFIEVDDGGCFVLQ